MPFRWSTALTLALGLLAGGAQAQIALVEAVSGRAQVRPPNQSSVLPLAVGQAIQEGSEISTEAGASSTLRFTDGQKLAVSENSLARITGYRYDTAQPGNSTTLIQLARGALRSVSGWIGARNPSGVRVATATATIGIRGTDFLVAATEAATHSQVLAGEIAVTTPAGTVAVPAGSAVTAAAGQLPVLTSAAALPAGVAGSFGQLGSLQLAAAPAGAAVATGTAAGSLSTGAVIAIGAAVAGAAAAASGGGNDSGATGTGPTGTR